MEIKRSDWNVYRTELAVRISCPKCGLENYAHVHEYGPVFSKYFNGDKTEDKVHCPRCGTEWTVKLVEDKSESELLKVNSLYAIVAKDPRSTHAERGYEYLYIDRYAPFSYFGDIDVPAEWYRVVCLKDKTDGGTIIHCDDLRSCDRYVRDNFEILEDLNEPIQAYGTYLNTTIEKESNGFSFSHFDSEDEEEEQFTPDHDIWYDVSLREDIDKEEVIKFDKDYLNVDQVYFQHLGDGDCYNLVYHLSDGWVKIVEHCVTYTICCDTFFEWFKIGKESVNQDIPIKEDEDFKDRRVSPSNFKTSKTYEVRPYNRGGIHRDIRYICVNPYCPTVKFDDNYTDEWYAVWGGVTDQNISRKIYDNSTLEDCLDFIYNYFYVLEREDV